MRALVTGCSEGIGGATCLSLADDQARHGKKLKITVTDLRPNLGTETIVEALRSKGAEVHSAYGDMRSREAIDAIASTAAEKMGGLDVVVANAGVVVPGNAVDNDDDQFDLLFDVNVKAVWRLAKATHAHLGKTRGAFVATGSMSGLQPHPTLGLYGVSKAAVIHLCRTLAIEWGRDGIRVNAVCPGMTRTPLTEKIYQNEEVARARGEIVPLGRVATPRDIGELIAFLCSDRATYLSGQAILVDGALTNSMLWHLPVLPTGHVSTATK